MIFIRRKWLTWGMLICSVILLVLLMQTTKTGLVPQEDTGTVFVDVSTAPGSTVEQTRTVLDRIETRFKDLSQIEHYSKVAGNGLTSGYGQSSGFELYLQDKKITREEASTGNNTVIILGICIVLVYLILSALYESLFIPLAVILSVPFGLAGSFLFARMMGLENIFTCKQVLSC